MRVIVAAVLACLLVACESGGGLMKGGERKADSQLPLVPYPVSVDQKPGALGIASSLNLQPLAQAPTSAAAARRLLADLNLTEDPQAEQRLDLSLVHRPELGVEGYELIVDRHIKINANTDAGLFYGVQTLRQLLPTDGGQGYQLPKVTIVDAPEFLWRGSMLDVARSFLPLDYLKQHVDRMALFKLNKLHLHLSDDQGWRVEIQQYPGLTEIGGASAVKGGRSGFYTQQELKELVRYAAERHIDIIPEIDLPGHTQAALAAYNELACDDVENLSVYSGVEVGFSKLCLTKPDVVYPFVRAVLEEIVAIFPAEYIHIGGDEIKDPLYAEFIEATTQIVSEFGRTAVAWEAASVAETEPGILLQLWNDEYDIQPALDRGVRLILSPCSYTYFDHGNYAGQPDTYVWCRKEGIPLERAYSFNPQAYPQAVGVEAAMWSELVHTDETADNRLWPRLAATAEVAWTREDNRDYTQFLERLSRLRPHFDQLGIQYYPEPQLGWQ
jgi:hexosaminidase